MYEKLEECPICKHTKFSNHLICQDHTVSQESFALVKCTKCGLVFTNPRPDTDHIGKYYDDSNYISHTNSANNPINLAYKLVRTITLKQKLRLIKQYTDSKELLDFGCGSGIFLQFMASKGYRITGFEPHAATALHAEQLTSTTIHTDLSQLTSHTYDIITAWHVMEHVHHLKKTIKALRKRLKKDGTLFVALPNHCSFDADHYKQYWAAYDVPKHLYHFDRDSIKALAHKCKLKVVDIHPMKFDAFYVSLLSEKNSPGKFNPFTALQTGIQSNKKAKATGEYSSLIYVLQA